MATYVMSDLHGNVSAFEKMLDTIKFNPDTDKLYLLGDYIDCGEDSIAMLLKLMSMTEQGSTVCLMGNHDKMMLSALEDLGYGGNNDTDTLDAIPYTNNMMLWYKNKGEKTLKDFLNLAEYNPGKAVEIYNWLNGLEYYIDNLEVNGKKYYLTHSMPKSSVEDNKEDMLWDRLRLDHLAIEFLEFLENYPDTTLINGHTPSCYYRTEKSCEIYKCDNKPYINIDCGAKSLSVSDIVYLGCLRLDDLAEYYVR